MFFATAAVYLYILDISIKIISFENRCGVLFMFVTNDRLHETVKNSSTTYALAVNDAMEFANNTIEVSY